MLPLTKHGLAQHHDARANHFSLDQKVFHASPNHDYLMVRDILIRSLACWGSPGSGKTRTLFLALLLAAIRDCLHSAVIFIVKPELLERVLEVIESAGKMDRVRIIEENGKQRLNPVEWSMEFARKHQKGIPVRALTGVIDNLLEVYHRGRIRTEQESFWGGSGENWTHDNVKLLYRRSGGCDISNLMELCQGMPTGAAPFDNPEKNAGLKMLTELHASGQWDDELAAIWKSYEFYSSLAPETSTSISVNAVTRIKPVTEDPIKSALFSGLSTITPEQVDREGLILIVNYPVEVYGAAGKAIGGAILDVFQRYIMSRGDGPEVRGMGLWLDEGFSLALPTTSDFCEKSRSSSGYSVWTGQTLASSVKGFGGDEGQAKALRGAIGAHSFFRNIDPETRDWAEAMAGKKLHWQVSFSEVQDGEGKKSISEHEVAALPERKMLGIRTSAKESFAEAYLIDGRRWNHGGDFHIMIRWPIPGFKWRWWTSFFDRAPKARYWSDFPRWYQIWRDSFEKVERVYRRVHEAVYGTR